jgi:hypothetical protein
LISSSREAEVISAELGEQIPLNCFMAFRERERISTASRKALGEVQRLRREKDEEAFEKSRGERSRYLSSFPVPPSRARSEYFSNRVTRNSFWN